jgi:hypothetical protein
MATNETEVTFILEYLSKPSLAMLEMAAKREVEDYATAAELTQADHDEMNNRLGAIRAELGKRRKADRS